jgi:hypothetical protein
MGAEDLSEPAYRLGSGCLVDQLVGQFLARVCGLDYLVEPEHVRQKLQSLCRYNWWDSFAGHLNNLRSCVLGDGTGLLMVDYPGDRPEKLFPCFNEVMTGFEYTAAVGMPFRWRAAGRDRGGGAALRRGDPRAVRWAGAEPL